ncbi:hypothetical protein BKE38_05070 [Pseudoroseomonas deserti]|uniref:Uncharacterized protein n=1 Tax=Teichococcus deserti TaxID=1817963 RepID=A0A1V2H7Z6_9PROT|nr:hypothetical protein BKE38_05070 [Pseudoroseomonas deserti]
MRSAPGAFPDVVRPPEGGYWEAGGRLWKPNPRFYIPRNIFHVVSLWFRCQGGMGGLAQLPGVGGVGDQAAWLMRAFSLLDGEEAKARRAKES